MCFYEKVGFPSLIQFRLAFCAPRRPAFPSILGPTGNDLGSPKSYPARFLPWNTTVGSQLSLWYPCYGTNHPPIASSQRWHLWWLKYAQMNRRGDGLVNGNKSTQPFELYQILIRDNTMFSWTFALAPPKPANTASSIVSYRNMDMPHNWVPKKLHCMVYHLPTNTCHKLAHDSILRQNSHEQRSTPEMSSLYTASSIGIMIRYPPIKRGNGKFLINGSF